MICLNHPGTAATWVCAKCSRSFCDGCIRSVAVGDKAGAICPSCGQRCVHIAPREEERAETSTFWRDLPGVFIFPFRGPGLSTMIVGAVFLALIALVWVPSLGPMTRFCASILGRIPGAILARLVWLPILFIACGYMCRYLLSVASSSAEGRKQPPNFDQIESERPLSSLWRFCVPLVLSFGPCLICLIYLWPTFASVPSVVQRTLTIALLIAGSLYFPVSLGAVAVSGTPRAAGPVRAARSILRVPVRYTITWLIFNLLITGLFLAYARRTAGALAQIPVLGAVIQFLAFLCLRAIEYAIVLLAWLRLPAPFYVFLAVALLSFVSAYSWIAAMHMLAVLYRTSRHRLDSLLRTKRGSPLVSAVAAVGALAILIAPFLSTVRGIRPGAKGYAKGGRLAGTETVRESARRNQCMRNVRQLAAAQRSYARDHAGSFSRRLSELYPGYVSSLSVFTCPSAGGPKITGKEHVDSRTTYVLRQGLTENSPQHELLIYDNLQNHGREGVNAACVEARVIWLSASRFRSIIAEGQRRPTELAKEALEGWQLVAQWGSEGSGDGQFRQPHGVAVDPWGNVYVADTYNNRVQKFDSSGRFLAKWPTNRSRYGGPPRPHAVVTDSRGSVLVVTQPDATIQKFDTLGRFLGVCGSIGEGDGQLRLPEGLALDSKGNIYVADTYNNRVQEFDSSGRFLGKWGSPGSGNGQFRDPSGIALDSLGNVYVADEGNSRIQKFDHSGKFLAKWGSSGIWEREFNNPSCVAIDSKGNLFIADSGNDRIQILDSSGRFLAKSRTRGSPYAHFENPRAVAVGPRGNLYVADTGNHRIKMFRPRR